MAKFNDKISTILNSQLPEFVVADHPKFAEFLRVYYQLLESAELSIDTIEGTDGILLQSETGQTNNLVLNSSSKGTARTLIDAGDKILLEESTYGKFTKNETVTGQTSKATAIVLVEDITNNRLIITSQDKFIDGEIIVGSSSGAQANITNYKPNPVNNIVDLVNFRDPDNAIGYFLTNMRDEFLATLPENLASGVNKRKLIKNIKSLYRAKGSVRGHEIFFRILFGENSETIYPREQMLKASDGQFDSLKVIRVIASIGDANQLVGRTITGQSSSATAIVENTSQFQIGDSTVTQLILNDDSIQGTFTVGEEIRGTITDGDDYFIKAAVTGIPGNKNITNDGSLNSTTDTISLTAGGTGALFQVEEIGPGSITEMVIDNAGSGYNIGDNLSFTNTGTNGSNAAGFVKIVNGGISGESGSGMSAGDRIVLEDETTSGDPYDGKVLVQEKFTGLQPITDFFLTNGGSQYTSLPTVTVTSSTGSSAVIKAFGTDVGKIVKVKTVELGRSYETSPTPPTLGFFNNGIVTNVSGTFLTTNSITSSSGGSGEIVNLDADRGLLKIKNVTGTFAIDDTLTSATSGTCTLKKLDRATASVDVVSVSDTDGAFISERGKLSETTMRVQDSLYYQDYSYVIKVGRSIAQWRDAFKKTMHTAGFYFTGQVDIESRVKVTAAGPVGLATSGGTETPFSVIANTLFLTVFGRRLGTKTDGTTLRPNAHLRSETIDVSNDFRDPFSSSTRDLTATRENIEIDYLSRQRNKLNDKSGIKHDVRSGYAYAGPRFSSINKHANTIFGTSAANSKANTFQALNSLRITGTKTAFDGQEVPYSIFNTVLGGSLKTNYAFPTQFSVSLELFSNTITKFDSNNITFDDTTP